MSDWTQPICHDCYSKRYPNREPTTLGSIDVETCIDCGKQVSGDVLDNEVIYVRIDPATLVKIGGSVLKTPALKIQKAIELILEYGPYDGAHHKMWVLDQVLRVLLEEDYRKTVGVDWDEGIAP